VAERQTPDRPQIDLRLWALFDNTNGTDADSDTEEEPEEDCLVRMERGSLAYG